MTDQTQILQEALALRQAGEAIALATVIRVEKPSSARPGDKAIITSDGKFRGWVGGSCAQPTIRKEALNALREGIPRYIRLAPAEKKGLHAQDGVIEVLLTCISGGTLEVYIEPFLPRPTLVAIGHLPIIKALVQLGALLDFELVVAGLDIDPEDFGEADRVTDTIDFTTLVAGPDTFVVVGSHGNYDEAALEWALRSEAPYVALVTSQKRGDAVVNSLRGAGVPEESIDRLKYPAGLDIGATTPEEIALSILTEIVQFRRQRGSSPNVRAGLSVIKVREVIEAIDPICGMKVDIQSARFTSEYLGETYYFCCLGCQTTFEKEPEKHVV